MFGSQIDACLGYTKDGNFITQLPQGSEIDDYKMSIYVQIIDNDNGVTVFKFENQTKAFTRPFRHLSDQIILLRKISKVVRLKLNRYCRKNLKNKKALSKKSPAFL